MSKAIRPEQTINGSFGELWVAGDLIGSCTGFQANIEIEYEDINTPRKLGKGRKMIGWEGKGEIKINKVILRFITILSDNLKAGKQTTVLIISKLDDPDALGAERVVIKDATFDSMMLAGWESKKVIEETIPFAFSDWELLDFIEG